MTTLTILLAFLAGVVFLRVPVLPAPRPGIRELHGWNNACRFTQGEASGVPPLTGLRSRLHHCVRGTVGLGRTRRLPPAGLRRDPAPGGRRNPHRHGPACRRAHPHLTPLPAGFGPHGAAHRKVGVRRRHRQGPCPQLWPLDPDRHGLRRWLDPVHRAHPRRHHRPGLVERKCRPGHGPSHRLRGGSRGPLRPRRCRSHRSEPATRVVPQTRGRDFAGDRRNAHRGRLPDDHQPFSSSCPAPYPPSESEKEFT